MESEDLIVGIAFRDIDLYEYPSEDTTYYGYVCCAARKLSIGEENGSYGEACVVGDRVGIMLEFDEKEAKLSFYRNNVLHLVYCRKPWVLLLLGFLLMSIILLPPCVTMELK